MLVKFGPHWSTTPELKYKVEKTINAIDIQIGENVNTILPVGKKIITIVLFFNAI